MEMGGGAMQRLSGPHATMTDRLQASLCCAALCIATLGSVRAEEIDRRQLVERHNPCITQYSPKSPLSVGNGEFAFSFDITGLQTFPEVQPCVPLGTMAQWGWHTFPSSKRYRYEETLHNYPVYGREVSYSTDMESPAAQALRANPHRFNLARIGLLLRDKQGSRVSDPEALTETRQELSLWTGESASHFQYDGHPVQVRTLAHPTLDAIAFSIKSPLIAKNRLAVEVSFAYPAGVWGPTVDAWDCPEKHASNLASQGGRHRILRSLDDVAHALDIHTKGTVRSTNDSHLFVVESHDKNAGVLEGAIHFLKTQEQPTAALNYESVRNAAREHWREFWSTGGAIDLSESTDPRWRELERRIVLSQYQTAINCSGSMPPQETGLVCNSWFGKSHLEMHWWHAAHFTLWGRGELLERSLDWYQKILPAARRIAERQGYSGVRWPKMTGPHGVSSPSNVGELLIWQQPHPIYFAELAYRRQPSRETLLRFQEIVEQTANFMADYASHDSEQDRYILGPVLIPAQECYDGRSQEGVLNPTFELAYWRWGLNAAIEWRKRLGLEPPTQWEEVSRKLARPTIQQGVYTAIENSPFTRRRDHPSMLAAFGVLPDVGMIAPDTMGRTLDDVVRDWSWKDTWGWDYPMMAMTAARLGRRRQAVDFLLFDSPKNQYLANGHCWQADRLPLYLPANGGLLTTAAMMAAGWDGSEDFGDAPGFPDDASWKVKHEGLQRMP